MQIKRIPKRIFGKLSKFCHICGNITMITAASEAFYSRLRNILLPSLMLHESAADVIIWDLGLNEEQREDLQILFKGHKGTMQLYTYPAEDLPAHYATLSTYAFKCYCIYHSLSKIKTRYAIWLDTGSLIVDYMSAERNLIKMYGSYVSLSNHSIAKLTHPTVMNKFYIEMAECSKKPMLYAGLMGWDMNNSEIMYLLNDWYQLSKNKDNISPLGSSKKNHRFDQSLLSLLYYSVYGDVPYLCRFRYNIKIQQ